MADKALKQKAKHQKHKLSRVSLAAAHKLISKSSELQEAANMHLIEQELEIAEEEFFEELVEERTYLVRSSSYKF